MSQNDNLHPTIQKIRKQRTFCMIKPDGVARGLIGEIIHRIEKAGLKVVALKMLIPTREQAINHYPTSDEAWVHRLGGKSLGTFQDLQLDAKEFLGKDDQMEVGRDVAKSLADFLTSGPVICMVVEGIQAIDMIRKLAGHTIPAKAEMGTIRGDFSVDSPAVANVQGRAIHNLFHASETEQEAEHEVKLWFTEKEVNEYLRSGEDVMFSKTY